MSLNKARAARAQARTANARTYQGQDCDHAHGGERYTSNGTCIHCAVMQRQEQAQRLRAAREAAGNPMRAPRGSRKAMAPAPLGDDLLSDL